MAEDFLAQVRSLNPDLAGYDDQTLAAAIGDQHPDYKPKLAKYFPDTAANVLSAQGAAAPPPTVDDEAAVDPKEAARLEFAKAHEDISPFAAAEKGAAYLGSEPVKEQIKGLPWGVRGAANVAAATGQFALEQVTPENVAIAAALPLLPGAKAASAVARATPRVVSGLFAGTALYDTLKRFPVLYDLYQKGDWDNFEREATKAGLGAGFVYMLTKHAIKGRAAQEQGDQVADLKAKQKVAEVLGTPEAQADVAKQQEVVDALNAATAPKAPVKAPGGNELWTVVTPRGTARWVATEAEARALVEKAPGSKVTPPAGRTAPPDLVTESAKSPLTEQEQDLLDQYGTAEYEDVERGYGPNQAPLLWDEIRRAKEKLAASAVDEMRPKDLPETVGAAPPIVPGAKGAVRGPEGGAGGPVTPEELAAANAPPEVRDTAPAPGFVRLYRGQNPAKTYPEASYSKDAGRWFTDDVETAKTYGGGAVRYVDVPEKTYREAVLSQEEATRLGGGYGVPSKGTVMLLPEDANRAQPFRQEAVETPGGEKVIPNDRAQPEMTAELKQQMADAGVDPTDHDAIAAFLTQLYGLKKPMVVESVGEVPTSVANETPDAYPIKLGKGPPAELLSHEVQHARVEEGQIPTVPEGPGANDTIVDQVAKDIEPVAGLNPKYYDVRPEVGQGILEDSQQLRAGKRGPISWEQAIQAGSEAGLSLADIKTLGEKSHEWVAQAAELRRNVTTANNQKYVALEEYKANPTPANAARKSAAHKNAMEVMASQTEFASNSARALNLQKMKAKALTPKEVAAQEALATITEELNRLAEGGKDVAKENKRLEDVDLRDPVAASKFKKSLSIKGVPLMRKINFFFGNAIVSAIPTAGVKAMSDAAAIISSPVRTLLGSTANLGRYGVLKALGKEAPGGLPHPIAETHARGAAIWSAVSDALTAFTESAKQKSLEPLAQTEFGRSVKTGSTMYNRTNPIGEGMRVPYSGEGAGFLHPFEGDPHMIDTRLFGSVVGIPYRILGAITDAAVQVGIRGELYERGIRDAMNSGEKGSAAWEAARKYVNDMPDDLKVLDEDTAGAIGPEKSKRLLQAQTEARKDTATQKPGRITKQILGLREEVPGMYMEAPIITTPQNIVKAAFETSPAGFLSIIGDFAKGREVSNSKMGRAVMGSMIWYWGYKLAMADRVTGAGPTDPKEFRNKYAAGYRPQSVLAPGGQYIPLRAFGPLGYSLGTIADIAEIVKEAPKHPGIEKLAIMSADHVMRFALEQPMVQGLADMFELMKDPAYIPVALGRTAGGFVPSIVARLGASLDTNQRRIDTFGDAIRARIPIFREGLSAKHDWRGRPVLEPGTPAERSLSPVARSEAMDLTPSDQAYLDAKIAPLTSKVKVKGMDFNLTRPDMDRYEQLAGAIVSKKFDAIDKAPSHLAALSDEERKDRIRSIVKGAREKALYGQGGLVSEMKKSGTYQTYVEAATGQKAAAAQVNPYTHIMSVPGAEKAQEQLDRYAVPDYGRPGNVPEELADEYNDELDRQRAMLFHQIYTHPEDLGSKPYEESRATVQEIDSVARKNAAAAVLRRAGVKR